MPTYFDKLANLTKIVQSIETEYRQTCAVRQAFNKPAEVRHKCFISYHGDDIDAVTDFVQTYKKVFIPRVVGASDDDSFKDPINSDDETYIKQQLGSKYLSDSTVTILFMGKCTWARRYVDWELSSTLFDGQVNKRSGLFAITPPDQSTYKLPERFSDNWNPGNSECYARYYYYPKSEDQLRVSIEDAFQARESRAHLVNNKRELRKRNGSC